MVVNAYTKAAIINEGNDISEEPMTAEMRTVGEWETGCAADLVCASTRWCLVSTPLNRGTVLTALLLSASSKRWWGRKKWLRWRGREREGIGTSGGEGRGKREGRGRTQMRREEERTQEWREGESEGEGEGFGEEVGGGRAQVERRGVWQEGGGRGRRSPFGTLDRGGGGGGEEEGCRQEDGHRQLYRAGSRRTSMTYWFAW
jgi:hypothetical protein